MARGQKKEGNIGETRQEEALKKKGLPPGLAIKKSGDQKGRTMKRSAYTYFFRLKAEGSFG